MEDYVTYEQALRLKELGFDWDCNHYYRLDTSIHQQTKSDYFNFNHISYLISAPTLAWAQKWLREVKEIHIWIESEPNEYDDNITYAIYIWDNNKREFPTYYEGAECRDTYEQALSAGIDKALELLK